MKQVLLVQPGYSGLEPESYHAAQLATVRRDTCKVGIMRPCASLLAHAFNLGAAYCLNNKYEYFAMLHGDIAAPAGWLDTLLDIVDSGMCDVIHAVAPIKDHRRITSTAWAYWDDQFAPVRRLTVKELAKLPETFTVEDVRTGIDADAKRLLPNTGCLVFRADTWFRRFTGFTINDQVATLDGDEYSVDVMPEDWNFGHWCGRNFLKVAGTTAVKVQHFGRWTFTCEPGNTGWEVDEHYLEAIGQKTEGANDAS